MAVDTLLLENTNFFKNNISFYSELRDREELHDVTLACDDQEFKVHKVIVSAASLLLRKVVKQSQHPTPYIYLKGIVGQDLDAMLNFMYTGEARVHQDNINRFMDAASELKVEGLYTFKTEEVEQIPEKSNSKTILSKKKKTKKELEKDLLVLEENVNDEKSNNISAPVIDTSFMNDNPELDKLVEQMIEETQNEENKKSFVCKKCGKAFPKMSKIKLHVETHIDGFEHRCSVCDKVKKTRSALLSHHYSCHSEKSK